MQSLSTEICRVGRSLYERGYVHATAGNISVRLPDGAGFLITPTDACLGFLDAETLAHVDTAGRQLSGARASKTLALHRAMQEAGLVDALEPGARTQLARRHAHPCLALPTVASTPAVGRLPPGEV